MILGVDDEEKRSSEGDFSADILRCGEGYKNFRYASLTRKISGSSGTISTHNAGLPGVSYGNPFYLDGACYITQLPHLLPISRCKIFERIIYLDNDTDCCCKIGRAGIVIPGVERCWMADQASTLQT